MISYKKFANIEKLKIICQNIDIYLNNNGL